MSRDTLIWFIVLVEKYLVYAAERRRSGLRQDSWSLPRERSYRSFDHVQPSAASNHLESNAASNHVNVDNEKLAKIKDVMYRDLSEGLRIHYDWDNLLSVSRGGMELELGMLPNQDQQPEEIITFSERDRKSMAKFIFRNATEGRSIDLDKALWSICVKEELDYASMFVKVGGSGKKRMAGGLFNITNYIADSPDDDRFCALLSKHYFSEFDFIEFKLQDIEKWIKSNTATQSMKEDDKTFIKEFIKQKTYTLIVVKFLHSAKLFESEINLVYGYIRDSIAFLKYWSEEKKKNGGEEISELNFVDRMVKELQLIETFGGSNILLELVYLMRKEEKLVAEIVDQEKLDQARLTEKIETDIEEITKLFDNAGIDSVKESG